MKTVLLAAVVIGGIACRESTSPLNHVRVTVDSAAYHLAPSVGPYYSITLSATISNSSSSDVFLLRECPTFSIARPAGFPGRLQFGQYGCAVAGGNGPKVLTLSPGETHTESFKLEGSEQPQARPVITMSDLVGPAVFGYMVSADLKTFSAHYSDTFQLVAPVK